MQHLANKYPDGRVTGTFTLGCSTEVFGDLKLKGAQTTLDLRHGEFFATHKIPDNCVTGILHDLTRVSLFNCFVTSHGTAGRYKEGYERATILPRFVAFGDAHIAPNDPVIQSIGFVVDDADVLFYDYEAFGSVIDARPYIEQILKANKPERDIPTGPYPQIQYFTGKTEILKVDTCLGVLIASHHPSWSMGTPAGVRIDNKISVRLDLPAPAAFFDAIEKMLPLLRFFELMIGRPQNIEEFWIKLPDLPEDRPNYLDVYWTTPPSRDTRHESRRPHPIDVLLSPVEDTAEFAGVIAKWLEHDSARQTARVRFAETSALQNYYPSDRIVSAANMFDILPEDAAPSTAQITPDILSAKDKSRELFLALPSSLEREAMLQALGRIGKASLKHKIRHRAKSIVAAIGQYLPDLELAIDEAVNCRNYFVHGGRRSFDYGHQFGALVFLTNTLEFVFGVSDLIDAGWNIKAWGKNSSTLSHPFSAYRHNYELNIRELRKLLGRT